MKKRKKLLLLLSVMSVILLTTIEQPFAALLGGYSRTGTFYVANTTNGTIYNGTKVSASWKSVDGKATLVTSYLLENGKTVDVGSTYDGKEIIEASGTYTLKRDCMIFTYPLWYSHFYTEDVLPAGTYEVVYQAYEFVCLKTETGETVWVSPQYKDVDTYLSTNYGDFDNGVSSLSVTSVNGIPVYEKFMPIRRDKRNGISIQPQYVTIHNTATTSAGATAAQFASNQINDSRTWVSWHFTVDNISIYQSIPMDEGAYHAGDGTNMGNAATIAIEICENSDGNYAQAEKNAAYLTAQILFDNGLPSDAVKGHVDWSGKNCPHNLIEGTNGSMGWDAFLELVATEYERLEQEAAENLLDSVIPDSFTAIKEGLGDSYQNGYLKDVTGGTTLLNLQETLQGYDPDVTISVIKDKSSISLDSIVTSGQTVTVTKGEESFTFMTIVNGDVNGDGKIGSIDFLMIKDYIMGEVDFYEYEKLAADVDGSNAIGSIDYLMIKDYIMGDLKSL